MFCGRESTNACVTLIDVAYFGCQYFRKKSLMDILDQPQNTEAKQARSIESVLRDGYEFRFGDYLGRMFQLFGKTWANLLGHGAILFGSYLVVYVLIVLLMVGTVFSSLPRANSDGTMDPEIAADFGINMLSNMMWMMLVIFIWFIVWVMPFRSGIYAHLEHYTHSGKLEFSKFFEPIKRKWAKLIGLTLLNGLLTYGISTAIGVVMMQNMFENMPAMMSQNDQEAALNFASSISAGMVWIFLSYIPMIFFAVASSLSVPILLFQTDSVMEAFTSSVKIVTRKWFHFAAVYIIVYVLSFLGVFACGIGLLLTMQFFPIVIYAIYEDIFILQNQAT